MRLFLKLLMINLEQLFYIFLFFSTFSKFYSQLEIQRIIEIETVI